MSDIRKHLWKFTDWEKVDIDEEQAMKICTKCELQVLMSRRLEFEGYGLRVPKEYRLPGQPWVKMYSRDGHKALPDCKPVNHE